MSKNHYHNYNAISNKPADNTVETTDIVNDNHETVITSDVTNTELEAPTTKVGFVSGCVRLNVRKTPKLNAEIVGILNAADEVLVDVDNSTDDFYKVSSSKVDGYCMKQYITLD